MVVRLMMMMMMMLRMMKMMMMSIEIVMTIYTITMTTFNSGLTLDEDLAGSRMESIVFAPYGFWSPASTKFSASFSLLQNFSPSSFPLKLLIPFYFSRRRFRLGFFPENGSLKNQLPH